MLLAVPDCPNAPVLDERLAAVLDDRARVPVTHEVISDESEVTRWACTVAPTI